MSKQSYSIPTMYKGRRYRSRLEARWAAFFDQLRWDHEYEPFDLKGWIPDFLLTIGEDSALVEIKPFATLDEYRDYFKKYDNYRHCFKKYVDALFNSAYWGIPLWILGPSIGTIRYGKSRNGSALFSLGFYGMHDPDGVNSRDLPSILAPNGESYAFDFICTPQLFAEGRAQQAWNHAGNITQYKRP